MSDMPATSRISATSALGMLINREEVLEIAFWYQGEGFGETFDGAALSVFLNCGREIVEAALGELVAQGSLEAVATGGYRFTPPGRAYAARLFHEGFADYQKPGHGECVEGCCEDGDHSRCGDECALHGSGEADRDVPGHDRESNDHVTLT
jgi:hypothetical protein